MKEKVYLFWIGGAPEPNQSYSMTHAVSLSFWKPYQGLIDSNFEKCNVDLYLTDARNILLKNIDKTAHVYHKFCSWETVIELQSSISSILSKSCRNKKNLVISWFILWTFCMNYFQKPIWFGLRLGISRVRTGCTSREPDCTPFYKIVRYHKISKIGQFHLCSDIRKPRKIYWSDKVLPAGSWAWFGKSDGQTLTSLDPRRPRLWSSPTFVPGKSISTKFNTINRLTRIIELVNYALQY